MDGDFIQVPDDETGAEPKLVWTTPALQTLAALDGVLSGAASFTDGTGGYSS